MAKKPTTTAVATTAPTAADKSADVGAFAKGADVGRLQVPADVAAFAGGLGIDLTGSIDERANLAAEHMNRSQRHMLASGLLLASIKAECEHGRFAELVEERGFEMRAAQKAMQYAQFIFTQPEATRLRLIEMPRSKVMEIAGADPEVIESLLGDGQADVDKLDALSVRALRQKISELEEATTDLQVQRDTAEAEAEGLRKKLKRGLPDRADGIPHAVADLRAELLARGKQASLALEGFTPLQADLEALGDTDAGREWADATLRLAASQVAALALQIGGLYKSLLDRLPGRDTAPSPASYLSKQEVAETAKRFAELAQFDDFEKRLREWEREQERPQGKGRPKSKPVAPGATS